MDLGAFRGERVSRSEEEFVVAGVTLDEVGQGNWGNGPRDLRWILVHLIQETARHAGHADATRELLDGTKG